jgi:hypothetical protein
MGIPLIQRNTATHFPEACERFKHYDPLEGHPRPYNFYEATTQRIEVLLPGISYRSIDRL